RVLVVFDVSDSMGDSADPFKPHSPTKIARARAALAGALGQLSLDDAIGLRIFTTGLPGRAGGSADWRDVVPIGPLAQRGPALERAITALTPLRGSPLYAATRDAFDTAAQTADPQRINGVIVLTDGYNEVDRDNNLSALLAHLGTRSDIHVITIAYGMDADIATLRKIAQATNAWNYDASATLDLPDLLPRALANF
ncbi:MAG TPA: hypothetical protein VGP92_12010, partial [Acidimicrobiia bacterium]|nr:hypothetical protein [Acidimicrobiia bacterium]